MSARSSGPRLRRVSGRWVAGVGAALGWVAGAAPSLGAPNTFETALPVAEGEHVARVQGVLETSGDDPGTADRDMTVWTTEAAVGYGFTRDFAFFGVVPYVDKRLEETASGVRRARGARGLGDVRLFGRHTVWRDDAPGRTVRAAPYLGLELPTGSNDKSDGFGRLPADVQPGSGSWDPFAGVVVTYQTLDFQIDAQAAYEVKTRADGFEFGDVARLDGSLQYRLWPRVLGAGTPGFLYGLIEANLIHRDKNRDRGRADPDSGGTTVFLAPGLQYVTKRWIAKGVVQIPVAHTLNGNALEAGVIARVGVRANF